AEPGSCRRLVPGRAVRLTMLPWEFLAADGSGSGWSCVARADAAWAGASVLARSAAPAATTPTLATRCPLVPGPVRRVPPGRANGSCMWCLSSNHRDAHGYTSAYPSTGTAQTPPEARRRSLSGWSRNLGVVRPADDHDDRVLVPGVHCTGSQ